MSRSADTASIERKINESYHDIYETLVELSMTLDDAGLGGSKGAMELRAFLRAMATAHDARAFEKMEALCKVLKATLRPV